MYFFFCVFCLFAFMCLASVFCLFAFMCLASVWQLKQDVAYYYSSFLWQKGNQKTVMRQEIVKPVIIGTPFEIIQMVEAMRKLLLVKSIQRNSAICEINNLLKLLFDHTSLPISMRSHTLRKIYANWAYLILIHGTPGVSEYAYICSILGQDYNPDSAASYSYFDIKWSSNISTLHLIYLHLQLYEYTVHACML